LAGAVAAAAALPEADVLLLLVAPVLDEPAVVLPVRVLVVAAESEVTAEVEPERVLPEWAMVPLELLVLSLISLLLPLAPLLVDGGLVMVAEPESVADDDDAEPVADAVGSVSWPADSDEHTATPALDALSRSVTPHAPSRQFCAAAPMAVCCAHWHDTSLSAQPTCVMAGVRQGI
jgi:hypothetical protein